MSSCGCDEGASRFFYENLHDCVYSFKDVVGWVFGISSLGCWLCAQVPQLLENMKKRSVEALSVGFIIFWVLGDVFNFFGCIFGGQLITQLMLSTYFIIMDVILVGQFVYYSQFRQDSSHKHDGIGALPKTQDETHSTLHHQLHNRFIKLRSKLMTYRAAFAILCCVGIVVFINHWRLTLRARMVQQTPLPNADACAHDPNLERIGTILGICSALMYLSSRIPQIWKNWRRRNAEGLAVMMFFMAFSGNTFYTLSVVVRARKMQDIMKAAPWLAGSAGALSQDVIIICQYLKYNRLKQSKSNANLPLSRSPANV